MQITFPTEQGYAGMFVIGQRERGGQIERTGTAVLKRAYIVDPVAATLTPAAEPIAVFQEDQPCNLVFNADFEAPQATPLDLAQADGWTPGGGTFARDPAAGVDFSSALGPSTAASLSGAGATLAQTIAFEQPLGGRTFMLSFYAKTNLVAPFVTAQVQVRLEEPGTAQICVINAALTDTMQRFSSQGTWPAAVTASETRIVLEGPTDATRFAYFDRVQLEERSTLTLWDPETELHYESDLAPYKPEADLIVLGFTDVAGGSSASVEGVTWLQRPIAITNTTTTTAAPVSQFEKAIFGWQSRVETGARKQAVGTIPSPPTPAPPTLLPLFSNAFYNGFRRDAAQAAAQPFTIPSPTAEIRLDRAATGPNPDYVFRLRGDEAVASLQFYGGAGPDDASNWSEQSVPMVLDTVVLEPESNRCYVVWRGVWSFDDLPEAAYRRLAVTASS